ncbi:MAG TPA: helix-hairpin-helix domain-containing protein [Terriglobia bacterium]|nr:helix-hairpin-helix domain-containing protein [Terriglobia bacterium]
MRRLLATIGVALIFSVTGLPAQEPAASLPDGAGKDVFVSVCSLCHDPTAVLNKRWTEKQWDAKVTEMLQEEPDVTAEERTAIVAYLAANFKPLPGVNVNQSTAAELVAALGLSLGEAESIVRYRKDNGPFKTLDDLKRIPGVNAAALEAARDRIVF